jgi:hypothetical protein
LPCFAPSIAREIGATLTRVKSDKFQTETPPQDRPSAWSGSPNYDLRATRNLEALTMTGRPLPKGVIGSGSKFVKRSPPRPPRSGRCKPSGQRP